MTLVDINTAKELKDFSFINNLCLKDERSN
jgi:hypothetical protein